MKGKSSEFHSGYYRPLINLSYNLDYKIWGMHALGFRITNLALHIMTCLMLYMTLKLVTSLREASLIIVLLFGLHPANTESVSWISARNNILVTLFGLLSFYQYVKSEMTNKIYPYIISLISFAASLLSKEFGIMLLPILFFYNRFLNGRERTLFGEVWRYIPFITLAIFYILIRKTATDSIIGNINVIDLGRALIFAPFVIMYDLRLIFLPYSLHNFIVSYPENPISKETLYGFIGIVIIGLLIYRYKSSKKLLFSSFSCIISLFPILHIIPTSAVSIVSLRWVYFPMVWLLFYGVFWLGKALETKYRILCFTLSGIMILYFGFYTYILNQSLWRSNETFFKSEVLIFDNEFYLDDLAGLYHKKREYKKAYSCYKKAISKYPEDSQLYINMGVLLIEMNRPDEALSYLEKADDRELKKEDKAKHFNAMGAAYFKKADYDNSIKFFSKAFQANPGKPSFCMNLGIAYRQAGRFEESIDVLKKCIDLKADPVKVRKELAYNYMETKDYRNAIKVLEEISSQEAKQDPRIKEMLEKAYQRLMNE